MPEILSPNLNFQRILNYYQQLFTFTVLHGESANSVDKSLLYEKRKETFLKYDSQAAVQELQRLIVGKRRHSLGTEVETCGAP